MKNNLDLKFIGLNGMAESGKDTVCEHLVQTFDNTVRYALGDVLRQELCLVFDLEFDKMLERTKDTELSTITWGDLMSVTGIEQRGFSREYLTYRQLMQYYATEYRRDTDPDYWLNQFKYNVEVMYPDKCVIIPDVRFKNECDFVLNRGLQLRLNSDTPEGEHDSEKLLPRYHFDIDAKGLSDVETTCNKAVEACYYQQFVLNKKKGVTLCQG